MNEAKSRLLLTYALAGTSLVGCGGGGGGGLPDPGLSNVKVETGSARSAVITSEGGSISATGSNGVVYTLTLPEGAVYEDTKISMYPISSLANLPGGGKTIAGVHFSPEGLQLFASSKLTMQLPAGIDASQVVGLAYKRNSEDLRLDMAMAQGQTVTMFVDHFSGKALGGRTVPSLLQDPGGSPTVSTFQTAMARAAFDALNQQSNPSAQFTQILKNWYHAIPESVFQTCMSIPIPASGGISAGDAFTLAAGHDAYDAWLDGVLYAQIVTQQIAQTPFVGPNPELPDSEQVAVNFLHHYFDLWNAQCGHDEDNPIDGQFRSDPIEDAATAMFAGIWAQEWHIPLVPDALDEVTLLHKLDVLPVIEEKNFVSGSLPGDQLDLRAKVGVKIPRLNVNSRYDIPVKVKFSRGSTVLQTIDTNNSGLAHCNTAWPLGLNPLKIDILATIKRASGKQKPRIAVFDVATKFAGSAARIAFSSDVDGDFDIFTMDADGSHQTRLTSDPDDDRQPVISPDGTKIAFNRHHFPDDAIFVANIDGSNQVLLTNNQDSNPTWSPDGRKIAFESHRDGTGAIYVMNAGGSNQTRITFNGSKSFDGDFDPSWSPGGTQIAFASTSGSPLEIRTIKPDGSNQQVITHVTQDTAPVWSPDGTKIAFVSNRDGHSEVYVMNADGSNPKRLTNGSTGSDNPSWSPDGTKIAFHSHPSAAVDGIFLMSSNGGNPVGLVTNLGRSREPSFGRKP